MGGRRAGGVLVGGARRRAAGPRAGARGGTAARCGARAGAARARRGGPTYRARAPWARWRASRRPSAPGSCRRRSTGTPACTTPFVPIAFLRDR